LKNDVKTRIPTLLASSHKRKVPQEHDSISMSDTEVVAKITIAADQPGLDESTVAGGCDAVSLDNFIQVVGLLMNTPAAWSATMRS
jgi:hypothetical protein